MKTIEMICADTKLAPSNISLSTFGVIGAKRIWFYFLAQIGTELLCVMSNDSKQRKGDESPQK